MAKVGLLIGVSEYEPGLSPLPGAVKDVEAMQQVLQHSEMGSFDEVKTLPNPDPLVMQESIETLFSSRTKDDLALLFFSGHGVKDDSGRLYFATRITRKTSKGELVKATAVPAGFVQEIMSNSRCKRQVVILDCCFSGAFAEGMTAKDDGAVDIQTQLGGEGRAVLTSSTSTQYSFEQQGLALSAYTRYLVEGIETGAADLDSDEVISMDELHEYAKKKVQEAAPAMKPEIYAVREGYRIRLAKAPMGDPKLSYRKEVERRSSRGEISFIGRRILDDLQNNLGLSPEEAGAIEAEALKPYREYQEKLQRYKQALVEAIQHEDPLSNYTRHELQRYQEILGLREEDITPIEARIASQREEVQSRPSTQTDSSTEHTPAPPAIGPQSTIPAPPIPQNSLTDRSSLREPSATTPPKSQSPSSEQIANAASPINPSGTQPSSTPVPPHRKPELLWVGAGAVFLGFIGIFLLNLIFSNGKTNIDPAVAPAYSGQKASYGAWECTCNWGECKVSAEAVIKGYSAGWTYPIDESGWACNRQ